jgi:hypothetical protein
MAQIVAMFLGLAGGVVGWFATNLYGRSLVLLFELRALAHEEMLFSADLTPELELPLFNASGERLRRIASRLKALDETSPALLRRIWAAGDYHPGAAADALVGYAYAYDRSERRKWRDKVEGALRFSLWPDRDLLRMQRSSGTDAGCRK